MTVSLPERAEHLRKIHPVFRYERCSVTPAPEGLRLDFVFYLAPTFTFTPHWIIPLHQPEFAAQLCKNSLVQRLTFLIGMVELLSYWKLSCSPRIEIAAGQLANDEIPFWETLLRKGLGEFFFLNGISPDIDCEFIPCEIPISPVAKDTSPVSLATNSHLVLVGGGKDSTVTLELLKRTLAPGETHPAAFVVNPIPASLDAINTANYPHPLIAHRALDRMLRSANSQGYLNGHTPFSALIAFASSLAAYVNGYRYILASNESSASEGNTIFQGHEINHQYSKSVEFEGLFRDYASKLQLPVEYFSFLRPLNELQICGLFSTLSRHHQGFRSCNREQTLASRNRTLDGHKHENPPLRTGWCAQCPKCVFTYLCLRCFLTQEKLESIFGIDPSSTAEFDSLLSQLAGFSAHKPFECVGTYEEVRACIMHIASDSQAHESLQRQLNALVGQIQEASPPSLHVLMDRWNNQNFLPDSLVSRLRHSLYQLRVDHG